MWYKTQSFRFDSNIFLTTTIILHRIGVNKVSPTMAFESQTNHIINWLINYIINYIINC